MKVRDFRLAEHLPNRRPGGEPASPDELPRQRNGITPQMHGRYPDYNVLDEVDHWDRVTREVVMDRIDFGPDSDAHIKQWLDLNALKRLLHPRFDVLRTTSVLPMGDRGFLRIVNSARVNNALSRVIPRRYLEGAKERAGLGYTLVALAQRKP